MGKSPEIDAVGAASREYGVMVAMWACNTQTHTF